MKKAQPLYKQLKTSLKERINSGELVSGMLLPSEINLAGEYGCSRLTAHRALRELADEGFVERRRRAGTRVATRGSAGLKITIPRITDEVSAFGFAYRYEFLKSEFKVPPLHFAQALQVAPKTKHMHIVCRHWANKRVFQYENRWINTDTVPSAAKHSFRYLGPSLWLLDTVPFSELEQEISSVAATLKSAEILKVAQFTPLLQIKRRTTLNGKRLSSAILQYPGDLYTMRAVQQSS